MTMNFIRQDIFDHLSQVSIHSCFYVLHIGHPPCSKNDKFHNCVKYSHFAIHSPYILSTAEFELEKRQYGSQSLFSQKAVTCNLPPRLSSLQWKRGMAPRRAGGRKMNHSSHHYSFALHYHRQCREVTQLNESANSQFKSSDISSFVLWQCLSPNKQWRSENK